MMAKRSAARVGRLELKCTKEELALLKRAAERASMPVAVAVRQAAVAWARKLLAIAALALTGCGSASETRVARPDGVYLVTETRVDGACDGFATPEPIAFRGWVAQLHAVNCSNVQGAFTEERGGHAEWSVDCASQAAMYSGELHCAAPSCDAIEGVEYVEEDGIKGSLQIRGTREPGAPALAASRRPSQLCSAPAIAQ